ncbi:Crp/Fnr family transcriptional regulator [Oscillospiraceae bacterium PP1C4]
MKKYLEILINIPLFAGIQENELESLLGCLNAQVRHYPKGEIIMLSGAPMNSVGIVLEGSAQILKDDFNGNRNILARVKHGELFAEVFACIGIEHAPVTVLADTRAVVLFIDFRRIVSSCTSACAFHSRLIENMLRLMARKNMMLHEKVSCLGHRTTREKLEAFLLLHMEHAGTNPFEIPFSRNEMADYLCVDRSALSTVLGKMRDEEVIQYHKNSFELLDGFGVHK